MHHRPESSRLILLSTPVDVAGSCDRALRSTGASDDRDLSITRHLPPCHPNDLVQRPGRARDIWIPQESEQTGSVQGITSRLAFRLLRNDPEARLVIHMHRAGDTVASGYRVPNYRAHLAGHPGKIHVLTFDYHGFG
ncbi:hypothetical protein BDW60DRAFT_198705 [Aspergillus nidulans var. acristatus]